jgi:ABC-type lipoprotein export system ATPase subunit
MQNYFEIKNLHCSYDKKRVVLEIEKLEIPRGKIVFIVGPSGCGKSTILETLGLMNNTIIAGNCGADSQASTFVFKPTETESIDCMEIWKQSNDKLSDIRRNYFSFIFQQTNLMKNFSIFQNSIIPQLLKGGNKIYEEVVKQVGLEQILEENKENVGELSGGQQQRLSFVRAILPNFQIIFGDEPTGNLDPENADNLMKIIADEIKDTEKTAIIVSHTPQLYEKYADIIITIHKRTRPNGDTYGVINKDSVTIKQKS